MLKNLSFKLKIIIIFLIPIFALLYFSIFYIQTKYNELHESSMYKLSANITDSLSSLLLNIQIERGLSAGYIVSSQQVSLKKQLNKQYTKTDEAYKKFLTYVQRDDNAKHSIINKIGRINKPNVYTITSQFEQISTIRTNILMHKTEFEEEMNYYTTINTSILKAIETLSILLSNYNTDSVLISKIQHIKEYSGLERACIYNSLLSEKISKTCNHTILQLQLKQAQEQSLFIASASNKLIRIYENYLNEDNLEQIAHLRQEYANKKLSTKDALEWFEQATQRINSLEKVSSYLLQDFINYTNKIYKKSLQSLYIAAVIWIFLMTSFVFLFLFLIKLMHKEEKNVQDLKISACTFDSYEAITITDADANIIKVNNGFTKITGYTQEEVIGLNPKILKSFKHKEDFYKKMWDEIRDHGKWSGNIYNKRKNGEVYLERLTITAIKDETGKVLNYIGQFLDIDDIQKAKDKAVYQANHDFLTGVANRQQLMQRLHEEFARARRHNFLHAFLFIDLDNFKRINDSYGHSIGDLLIKEVTQRLKSIIREEDLLARISGDEFAILLLNLDEDEHHAAKIVKNISQKILLEISRPFIFDNKSLHISSSIGIKLFPDGEYKAEDVIIHADTAMYKAKKLGKNQFIFFDKKIEKELQALTIAEEEIKNALSNNEFTMYFQAKIDLKTRSIAGAELLSRWEHPQKGLLTPDHYISIATGMGTIHKFTLMALESASTFIQQYGDLFEGTLSINISSQEFFHPNFEQEIIDIISDYAIDPTKIELEITEDELIKDFHLALTKIHTLKEFGIKFSIDDFGTGYSSITYLQQLPVDTLKIDKSFLENIDTQTNKELFSMIVNISKLFGMNVVVEGIETQEQLDFLYTTQTDLYQGFYFSKAVSKEAFLNLLKENKETH